MPRHPEIRLDADAPGAIRRRLQPLAGGRGSHTRGPDHSLARDALAADDDAVGVDQVDAVTQPNLYPELLQPCPRGRRQAFGEGTEDARGHVDQDDSRLGGIDAPKLRSQRAAYENR